MLENHPEDLLVSLVKLLIQLLLFTLWPCEIFIWHFDRIDRIDRCNRRYCIVSVLHQNEGGIGKSISSALEIFLGRGFCTPRPSGFPSGFALGKSLGSRGAKPTASENLSDFPRPSRFPSGFALGKSLGSREIGRRGWISQYLPRLGGARIQSTLVKRCTIVHNATNHSAKLQVWRLTYSSTLGRRSTGVHNAPIQLLKLDILEATLCCATENHNRVLHVTSFFSN